MDKPTRFDELRRKEIRTRLECSMVGDEIHALAFESLDGLDKAEATIKAIGEFFPVCGEAQCMNHYEEIQALLDNHN